MLMPELLALYGPKLPDGLAVRVQEVIDERIRDSRSGTFNGKGRHMAVGPFVHAVHRVSCCFLMVKKTVHSTDVFPHNGREYTL